MKVENMTSSNGNRVANQFVIRGESPTLNPAAEANETVEIKCFQSYDSVIVRIECGSLDEVYLDERFWNYSRTTAKYRNLFLGKTTAQIQAKIDSGEYILTDLN